MRLFLTLLLLVFVGLAGCADSAPADDDDDSDFDDVDVEVDDSTGAIRGVVVDDTINPVADAAVELTVDANDIRETTSDEQGRFVFSKVPPGTYILKTSKFLHEDVQTSASVEAGVREPPVVKVQLPRLFEGEPYMAPVDFRGFFQCSQARFPGYLYSSSPCHSNNIGGYVASQTGLPVPSTDLDDYGVELDQERTFHSDIADGWQSLVFEMTWEPSAQGTSEKMGLVVSTYKPERDTSHFFANVDSASPMRLQIDQGVQHESASATEPSSIPPEGIQDMSYFMSVRPPDGTVCALWCVPPGFALEQEFHVYLNQFYYAPAPEGWSVINGDTDPF